MMRHVGGASYVAITHRDGGRMTRLCIEKCRSIRAGSWRKGLEPVEDVELFRVEGAAIEVPLGSTPIKACHCLA